MSGLLTLLEMSFVHHFVCLFVNRKFWSVIQEMVFVYFIS